jgi:hypothetical protein
MLDDGRIECRNANAMQNYENFAPRTSFLPADTQFQSNPLHFSSPVIHPFPLSPHLDVIHPPPRLQRSLNSITTILRIAKQHLRARHIKHRIRHIRITRTHPSLHHNNLLTLPRVQDRHACDRGAGFESDGVDGIVGADNERDVCVGEVVVDFVHFEDDFCSG